jgi:CoA:oxalate CoA-transferase
MGPVSRKDAAQLESEMSEHGIPCGMVRRAGEAAELSEEAGLLHRALGNVPVGGRPAIPGAGFHMSPDGPSTQEPPPRLDQDREEILAWLSEPATNRHDTPRATTLKRRI